MDAGRLQRLDEATRQANGDTVFIPVLLSLARCKAYRAWLNESFLRHVVEQQIAGRLFVHEVITVDEAIAGTMLQRYPPLPAHFMGNCSGIRLRVL